MHLNQPDKEVTHDTYRHRCAHWYIHQLVSYWVCRILEGPGGTLGSESFVRQTASSFCADLAYVKTEPPQFLKNGGRDSMSLGKGTVLASPSFKGWELTSRYHLLLDHLLMTLAYLFIRACDLRALYSNESLTHTHDFSSLHLNYICIRVVVFERFIRDIFTYYSYFLLIWIKQYAVHKMNPRIPDNTAKDPKCSSDCVELPLGQLSTSGWTHTYAMRMHILVYDHATGSPVSRIPQYYLWWNAYGWCKPSSMQEMLSNMNSCVLQRQCSITDSVKCCGFQSSPTIKFTGGSWAVSQHTLPHRVVVELLGRKHRYR